MTYEFKLRIECYVTFEDVWFGTTEYMLQCIYITWNQITIYHVIYNIDMIRIYDIIDDLQCYILTLLLAWSISCFMKNILYFQFKFQQAYVFLSYFQPSFKNHHHDSLKGNNNKIYKPIFRCLVTFVYLGNGFKSADTTRVIMCFESCKIKW